MDFSKLTEKLQEGFRAAQAKATRYGNQQIDVEHLFLALLEQEGGLAPSLLNKADLNVSTLATRLEAEIAKLPKVGGAGASPDQVYVTNRLQKVLTQAEDEAKRLKDEFVSIEHFLLALTDDNGPSG